MARYDIDPDRSTVWIDARSNIHPIKSTTVGLDGFVDIEWGPEGEVATAVGSAARVSFRVEKLTSGNRLEDRELMRRIDARRHPTIEGLLLAMNHVGPDGTYDVSGEVTFKGVTKRYEDRMSIHQIDDLHVRLAGSSRFDIRDFGMEPPRMLMFKVDPEVEVRIEIIASRKD